MDRDRGRLYPICCTAPLGAEVANRFINIDKEAFGDDLYWFRSFVFVNDLIACYEEQNDDEMVPDPGFPNSPFVDKNLQECHELLKELRDTTKSDINPYEFIIMDSRSQDDDSVIVVEVQEEAIKSFRAGFNMATAIMLCWISGRTNIEENIQMAQHQWDDVLRSYDGEEGLDS